MDHCVLPHQIEFYKKQGVSVLPWFLSSFPPFSFSFPSDLLRVRGASMTKGACVWSTLVGCLTKGDDDDDDCNNSNNLLNVLSWVIQVQLLVSSQRSMRLKCRSCQETALLGVKESGWQGNGISDPSDAPAVSLCAHTHTRAYSLLPMNMPKNNILWFMDVVFL